MLFDSGDKVIYGCLKMCLNMVVKTITINEDAYNILTSMKRSGESFSDVILRVGSENRVNLKDIFGKLKLPKKEFEEWKKELKTIRQEMEESHNVLTRHFSDVY